MKLQKIMAFLIGIILIFSLASCSNEGKEGGTNIQEAAVDEGDIVKIGEDGLIYNSQSDGISVTQTNNGLLNLIAGYSEKRFVPKEMFISGNYLVSIGGVSNEFSASGMQFLNYYGIRCPKTVVKIFDMTEVKNMDFGEESVLLDDYLLYSFTINAEYFTSRLYFDTKELYVIFNYSDYLTWDINNNKKREFKKSDIKYTENAEQKSFTDIEQIKDLEAEYYYYDATLIIKVELESEEMTATAKGYFGARFVDLYMSENALYPVFEMYNSDNSKKCYRNYIPYTYIIKVSPQNLQPLYQTKLTGYYIYGRYALKDFGDSFFVSATSRWQGSAVFAFDSEMKEIGKIEEIAPGEEIKAVTYQQTESQRYCFITTFRQVDPLFKIDITKPEDMIVLSALKITGFDTYLYNISDSYLIGVGYDGDLNSADMSTLKVSQYDASTDEVIVISYITISNIKYAEVLSNEKALAINKNNMIFGFSVLRDFNGIFYQGYYIFNIKGDRLNDLAYISNFNEGFVEYNYQNFRKFITRAFIFEGYVYFVSDSSIMSYSILQIGQENQTPYCNISTVLV